MTTKRRQARICSLKMLYAYDNCKMPVDEIVSFFESRIPKGETYKSFMMKLFDGVCKKKDEIDELIAKHAKNWEISRMAAVDRNIIRLAVYEIMEMPETPISVIIDEAVEISKKYSTKDSSKFVNGVLDKLKIIRSAK
ncbi:MAG: transcription antitermination factor NusB [Elusimicrobiota bacterium]|jgi:N utilization substance protein B|nr:transcription antitermination factor NusB [Elusimicrobiota bacterium]